MTVTPDGVDAEWDGHPFGMSATALAKTIAQEMPQVWKQYPEDPFVGKVRPEFVTRGGLGFYLFRGSASFRGVTVTPLDTGD
jgi:hypothetical protein